MKEKHWIVRNYEPTSNMIIFEYFALTIRDISAKSVYARARAHWTIDRFIGSILFENGIAANK